MTRKILILAFVIIHLVVFLQVVYYYTAISDISGADTTKHVLLLIFSPLAVYGYAFVHPKTNSRQKLSAGKAWMFISLNIFWSLLFSYILFITWGMPRIKEQDFLVYAEMISAFRVFIYSLFLPVFFPQSKPT